MFIHRRIRYRGGLVLVAVSVISMVALCMAQQIVHRSDVQLLNRNLRYEERLARLALAEADILRRKAERRGFATAGHPNECIAGEEILATIAWFNLLQYSAKRWESDAAIAAAVDDARIALDALQVSYLRLYAAERSGYGASEKLWIDVLWNCARARQQLRVLPVVQVQAYRISRHWLVRLIDHSGVLCAVFAVFGVTGVASIMKYKENI